MAQLFAGALVVNSVSCDYTIMLPRGCKDAAGGAPGRRAIICQHGHAAAGPGSWSYAISQGGQFVDHTRAWVDAGFVVACINTGGTAWYDQDAHDRIAALRAHLLTLGCKTKIGLSGWSMGGGTILSWAMLNPTLVAAVYPFSPALDLRWVAGKAGYVPAYSPGSDVAAAGWATEIGSDYPSGYDAHDPLQNVALFRGVFPVRIGHATDDATLPYAASPYFVAQVNDPKVTFRTPDVTGNHQGAIVQIPAAETLAFFVNNWQD